MMSSEAIDVPQSLERHAADLRMRAQARLGPHLRNRLDPSDLVQQTLMIGHARRDQFRGTTHAELRGWLRAILDQTVALAARRFHQFRPERASSLEQPIAPSFTRLGSVLPGNDSTPSHRAMRGEDLQRLADAIAALPTDQRIAVELYHFVDLPVAEVAADGSHRRRCDRPALPRRQIAPSSPGLNCPKGRR